MVQLGETYKDSISGFEGVAVARVVHLYGCVRVCLEGPDTEGKNATEYFDEQRLVDDSPAETGGPGGPVDASRDPVV